MDSTTTEGVYFMSGKKTVLGMVVLSGMALAFPLMPMGTAGTPVGDPVRTASIPFDNPTIRRIVRRSGGAP